MDKNHPLDCVCCECKDDEMINSLAPSTADINGEVCVCGVCTNEEIDLMKPGTYQSDVTLYKAPACTCKPDDCACCYCMACEGTTYRQW